MKSKIVLLCGVCTFVVFVITYPFVYGDMDFGNWLFCGSFIGIVAILFGIVAYIASRQDPTSDTTARVLYMGTAMEFEYLVGGDTGKKRNCNSKKLWSFDELLTLGDMQDKKCEAITIVVYGKRFGIKKN